MAKLNDLPPAPPVESIDALKRRFIRQNREIARVNSTQSQRIRNLETEISRLVAENISLREEAIAAHAETERWRAASSINREIFDLRDRLQQKVNEVGDLLGEMGRIPDKVARRGKRKSRMTGVGERVSSATEQEWRSRLSMREAIAEERGELDGRLPPIREDKQYPRRTMENAELSASKEEAALQEASESPELGPPPVAHFDVGECIGLDSARTSEDETTGDDVMHLPSMLERRRKRRTSTFLQNIPPEVSAEPRAEQPLEEPMLPQDPPTTRPTQQLLKSGAKRKLEASELEEPVLQQTQNENDDFVFQRRQEMWNSNPATAGRKATRFTRPPGRDSTAPSEAATHSPQKNTVATRKILAPKSTNSPTKRRVHVSEKLKDGREEQPKQAVIKPPRRNNPPLQPDVEPNAKSTTGQEVEEKNLPPKTPAAEADGILSPVSTEPSARNSHQLKEAAVINSVEDVLNGSIGRGSRRARPAVSYAEPNLRDKMRRPGKELVGAVEGLEKNKENPPSVKGASVDRAKSEDVRTDDDKCRVIKIKQERYTEPDERWKELPSRKKEEPASPLRDKEKRERANSDTKATERRNPGDDLEKAVNLLSIFDPQTSSPMEPSEEASTNRSGHKVPSTARRRPSTNGLATRRHSVQPSSSTLPTTNSDRPAPDVHASIRRTSTARAPLPRPSSAASTRSERMADIAKEMKRSNSVSSSLKDKDQTASGAEAGSIAISRAERTLNRRRSMMV
ncbi:hypothetical protein H2200_010028 [Cladophialophora chaetospira]|uniref:Shugoshin n=1 Tax=Cladophialophora chaetospira TaxID=386627 RepID=A0AA38X216_9EURO|nr:hypothetical protein H2200_010028 [Cladophialophora chaetospira]